MSASLGPAWIRLHPNSLDAIPKKALPAKDLFPGLPVNTVVSANSLIIAGKIPGAWLVHIKDADHQLMSQYPNKFNSIKYYKHFFQPQTKWLRYSGNPWSCDTSL